MKNDLVFDENIARWVASSLLISKAYRISATNDRALWYTWKSGIVAPVYCNVRQLISNPKCRLAAVSGLHQAVNTCFPDAEGIIGLATAGIGWANTLAHLKELPSGYIRAVPKEHGISGLVDYYNPAMRKVVIVDDLIASGGSIQKAILAAEQHNLDVIGILSIVNWGFPQMKNELGHKKVVALCSYPQILNQALQDNIIGHTEYDDLVAFYKNPKAHIWLSNMFSKKSDGG